MGRFWTQERQIRLTDALIAAIVLPAFWLARFAPLGLVSWGGALVGRLIGPFTAASRRAERNLAWAMPSLSPRARRRLVAGMWDNLGRTMAEFPLLPRLLDEDRRAGRKDGSGRRRPRITIDGLERLREAGVGTRPVIVAVAHTANWEVGQIVAARLGVRLHAFYRPLNNRRIDARVVRVREALGSVLLAKQRDGADARRALSILRRGGILCMLVDQHYSGGLVAPFLGRPAATSPAAVEFALHVGAPLLPIRIERIGGFRFRLVVEPPVELPRTGDRRADVLAGTAALNRVIERWIRERPEQWLWIHRRWRIGITRRRKRRRGRDQRPRRRARTGA